MIQRSLDLTYDKLVVGNDLMALAYSHEYRCPSIFLRHMVPYKYNERENGLYQKELWKEMAYSLFLNSQFPFGDRIVGIRLDNDTLKASTKDGFLCNIKFNHLYISDDYMLGGLPAPLKKTNDLNWVIDWFNVKNGTLHNFDTITDDKDDFVKKIYFYYSDRFYKNSGRKDLVSVSKINDTNLALDDYGQNVARLKTTRMMADAGIKGIWDKTNGRYKKPILTSVKREIYALGKNIYPDFSNKVTFLY